MNDSVNGRPERLATIGELAAGIAHEINNPVAYVRSNLDTLGEYLDDLLGLMRVYEEHERAAAGNGEPAPDLAEARRRAGYEEIVQDLPSLLKDCREGMSLVSGIVQALRDFARDSDDSKQLIDLNEIVHRALILARNSLKYKAEVSTQLDRVPLVQAHPGRLTQLMLNLLVNAAEALQEPGDILVRTAFADKRVQLYVADTGPGIEPSIRDRIFNPFFTTKGSEAGTGMGLAVAQEVAHELGGTIGLVDEPHYSTCFLVELPLRPE